MPTGVEDGARRVGKVCVQPYPQRSNLEAAALQCRYADVKDECAGLVAAAYEGDTQLDQRLAEVVMNEAAGAGPTGAVDVQRHAAKEGIPPNQQRRTLGAAAWQCEQADEVEDLAAMAEAACDEGTPPNRQRRLEEAALQCEQADEVVALAALDADAVERRVGQEGIPTHKQRRTLEAEAVQGVHADKKEEIAVLAAGAFEEGIPLNQQSASPKKAPGPVPGRGDLAAPGPEQGRGGREKEPRGHARHRPCPGRFGKAAEEAGLLGAGSQIEGSLVKGSLPDQQQAKECTPPEQQHAQCVGEQLKEDGESSGPCGVQVVQEQ